MFFHSKVTFVITQEKGVITKLGNVAGIMEIGLESQGRFQQNREN